MEPNVTHSKNKNHENLYSEVVLLKLRPGWMQGFSVWILWKQVDDHVNDSGWVIMDVVWDTK